MSSSFVGEIRMFGGLTAPEGWNLCDGTVLPISQAQALFSLIGTTYGGDGTSTFALPDLRGNTIVHRGQGKGLSNRTVGQVGGDAVVTLTPDQMPEHVHAVLAVPAAGIEVSPDQAMLAGPDDGSTMWTPGGGPGAAMQMAAGTVGPASGAGTPHENMMPSLAVSYIISLSGSMPK
ncbi:tail fiber protein [Sphingomonas sp. AOB5]|uniref:phage tail protein n=1 Tax=Sphingomonas sp. AOB5 TaxID=3034017 RepID=UPI0023F8456C|nr:tail fiber protein [Sphingomonas sp. AOB5]MDF7775936.1 tail fiber protein [Sphingomonas sp. AOB5]